MKLQQLICILSFLLIGACKNANPPKQDAFNIELYPKKKEYHIGETLQIKVVNPKFEGKIVKISYQFHHQELVVTNENIVLENLMLGKQPLEETVYTDKGEVYKVRKEILLLAGQAPKLYTYKILNEYPHDKQAYTQGLEFIGDTLVESTGQYRESSIRKWNPFTGEMYKNVPLQAMYFGEGSTVFRDKIIQLTWRENIGFVYDTQLKLLKTFSYHKSKEGWGLCHNGSDKLYKSDGSEKIWILNPNTFEEVDSLQLCTNKSIFTNANELEFVDGKIYANTYLKDGIMIINPNNGAIEGVVDVRGLKEKVEQTPDLDVLNGIAYHARRNTFFITGKNWSKIFEVIFINKN